jgi:hypothetical protein
MSCSPVRLIAARYPSSLPSGYPMYIANLQADTAVPGSQHSIWSQCHTPQNVWFRYPERYRGINPPVVADSLQLDSQIQHFELEDDSGICGSDNKERVEALKLRSSSSIQESSAPSCTSRPRTDEKLFTNSQPLSAASPRTTQAITATSPSDVLWAVPSTQRSR